MIGEVTQPRALGLHVERIERLAGCHEQPVALLAAETEIGTDLRKLDAQHRLALGREHHDAVELLTPGAPAAPEIAGGVAAEAVRRARTAIDEYPPVGKPRAIVDHVIDLDQA